MGVLFFLLIITFLFGQGKGELTTYGESQKRYERKVVIGLYPTFESMNFFVETEYCPLNAKVCYSLGKWGYRFLPKVVTSVSKEIYDWLITQRFDKVFFSKERVVLLSARAKVEVPYGSIRAFYLQNVDYEGFKKKVLEYLNGELAKPLKEILRASRKVRYEELPSKERGTFIREKAKEVGIPAKLLEKLLNSAYVFALYIPRTHGELKIKQVKKETLFGVKILYKAELKLPINFKVVVFKLEGESFKTYKRTFSGTSGGVIFSPTVSKEFPFRPTPEDLIPLVERAFFESVKSASISASYELKKDDNFAIFTVVEEVKGRRVFADVGVLEDLRVDAPYDVFLMENGRRSYKGFVKARVVSINCKKREWSEFELIKGSVEFKDQMREHPWTGLFVFGGFKVSPFTSTGAYQGTLNFNTFSLGLSLDLGYSLNVRYLSELWLSLGFSSGFSSNELNYNFGFVSRSFKSHSLSELFLSLSKRFYFTNLGLYLAPTLGFSSLSLSSEDQLQNKLETSSLSLYGGLSLGYNFSPNLEVSGFLAYNQLFGTKYKLNGTDITNFGDRPNLKGGLSFGIRINYHLPIVGFMSRLYRKPSKVCLKR